MLTMLFTDIVGSTELKTDLGDLRAVETIEKHHEIVRSLLTHYPDAEEISTAGDSFFIVFVRPSEAVLFALKLQSALRPFSREVGRPISDRIGIHVGEVFIQEHAERGSEFFGIQIDTSARIMSLGGRDQILLSRFAYDSARHTLRRRAIEGVGELSWLSHGFYNLKGVEDPTEVCEVGETGVALLTPPHNPNEEGTQTLALTTRDGKTYRNVNLTVIDSGLSVVTPDGGALIPFHQLPDDLSGLPAKLREEISKAKKVQAFKLGKAHRPLIPSGPSLTRFEASVIENYAKEAMKSRQVANIEVVAFVPSFTDELPAIAPPVAANVTKTIQFINRKIENRDRIIYYDHKIETFICGRVGFCPNGRIRILYDDCRSFHPADLNPDQIEKITGDDYSVSVGVYTVNRENSIARHEYNGTWSQTHSFVLPVADDEDARAVCKAIINFIRLYRRG